MQKYNATLTKEFLLKKLIGEQKTIIGLAEEVGCSKYTIIKYLKKYKIHEKVRKLSKFSNKKSKNLMGKTFGNLTVVDYAENDAHGKTRWKCLCKCGKTKIINASSLLRKLTTTCGYCARKNFKGYKDISGVFVRRLRESAHKRGYEFKITAEDIWNLYIKQDRKCALTGLPVVFKTNWDKINQQTASVNRINYKLGYTIDNIQIVHKKVNMLKGALTDEEVIFLAHKIANKWEYIDMTEEINLPRNSERHWI